VSKQKKEAPTPKPTKKGERKRCKSPRGAKLEKAVGQLLNEMDAGFKRHRNDYNHHMARVKKLAKLL
jgi:hypothetical protein